jgi:hypothetical protein
MRVEKRFAPSAAPSLAALLADLRRQTFEIDSEDLGQRRTIRYRFSFDGAKLHFHVAPEHDPEASIDGEQVDLR